MLPVAMVYCGLACTIIGLTVAIAGFVWPATVQRVAAPASRLDEFVPEWEFWERHEIEIAASVAEVDRAIRTVTADEIPLFQTLTWIRRFGRPGPESILHAPGRLPLLEVATRTTFRMLSDEPGREVVFGTTVIGRMPPGADGERFKALDREPGYAKAAMNFTIREIAPDRCLVVTETRVHATDSWSRRRFAAYWRLIYPGSATIRRSWLRAIRLRAERKLAARV